MKAHSDQPCVLLNSEGFDGVPALDDFMQWVQQVMAHHGRFFQVSIQVVDESYSQQLNKDYRGKDNPTNVLSFPLDLPAEVEEDLIGDLAICAQVVEQESQQQNKSLMHHWAHLTIHGTLHLLGYDHIEDDQAEVMEALEIDLLAQLNIANPYADGV